MDHQTHAKKLLVYYFQLLMEKATGEYLGPVCFSEIESIVDSIIEAAAEEGARRAVIELRAAVIE